MRGLGFSQLKFLRGNNKMVFKEARIEDFRFGNRYCVDIFSDDRYNGSIFCDDYQVVINTMKLIKKGEIIGMFRVDKVIKDDEIE